MRDELINPNIHIILVHFPIALIVVGTFIEVFSFLWRRSSFRQAGRWMLLIGALSGIPTAFSGVYALADVARMNNPQADATWQVAAAAAPLSDEAWALLKEHLILEVMAIALFVFVVVTWLGSNDHWRNLLHWPLVLVTLAATALMVNGAWHAGEAVYHTGVGVERHTRPEADLSRSTESGVSVVPALLVDEPVLKPATEEGSKLAILNQVEHVVPPVQTHVLLAGFMVAAALAALGLSFRASHGIRWYPVSLDRPETMPQAPQVGDAYQSAPGAAAGSGLDTEHIPAGRFWMLTFVLVAVTAASGWWALGSGSRAWLQSDVPGYLWKQVANTELRTDSLLNRRSAHLVTAVLILVIPLLLAVSARLARGNRTLIVLLGGLLLLAVAVQVWLGVLLLYDGPVGALTQFEPAAVTVATPAP